MTIENATPPGFGPATTGGLRKGWADRMIADTAQATRRAATETKSRRQGPRRCLMERSADAATAVAAGDGRRATRLSLPGGARS